MVQEGSNEKGLRKLFQDSVCVNIPMDVTADLGIAMKRTRQKRIKAIYEHFPSLKKDNAMKEQEDELDSEDDEEKKEKPNSDSAAPPTKKTKIDSHVPQKSQYGNVLDYLEAKYVRGVMLQDEDDAVLEDEDDQDEKAGSVYDSDSSFLDDSLLKRDVAEQVLSQATHTKLELEQDDDEFFVNVGALEVEDHGMMDYDPLEEDDDNTTKNSKKKRTPSVDSRFSKKSKEAVKNSTTSTDNGNGKKDLQKKKTVTTIPAKKSENTPPLIEVTPEVKEQIEALKKRAMDLKTNSDACFDKMRDAIKKMSGKELPRKKKNEKVSIVVPEGKTAGDDITFSNPHVPGQKLRVKVPKNSAPGSKFVVSVPVPVKANPDVDHNKWDRDAQNLLDDFSHAYDDWCHAEAAWREMDPNAIEKFQLHHERMNKFEKLLTVFPKDLLTPIDSTYLRKIVRRARQNKHKRAKQLSTAGTSASNPETGKAIPDEPPSSTTKPATTKIETSLVQESETKLNIPGKGTQFPRLPAPLDL